MADKGKTSRGRKGRDRAEHETIVNSEAFEALRKEFDQAIDRMAGYVRNVAEPWFADQAAPIGTGAGDGQCFAPLADLDEDEDGYQLSLELPGMTKDQVEIDIRGSTLAITGEKQVAREGSQGAGSWRERRYGNFHRIVPLPDDIDQKRIKASFKDGVLSVDLPKIANSRSKRRRIKIDTG